jgi:hypothetical protein
MCSPIAAGFYHRYVKWCLEVPRCEPMPEISHGRYYLDPNDEGRTDAIWLAKGSQYIAAAENENAPPVDLADLK